jgi:hypothetical protein
MAYLEHMIGRILMLTVAVGAAACGSATAPVSVPGPPGLMLPAGLKEALDNRWPQWEIVPPADAAACGTRFDRPPAAIITTDLNGDATEDFAFQIASPDGRHVVAALARIDQEYDILEVATGTDASAVLGVKRRGRSYRQQAEGVEHFFSLDTLAFGPCNQPETAYLWTGTAFQTTRVY